MVRLIAFAWLMILSEVIYNRFFKYKAATQQMQARYKSPYSATWRRIFCHIPIVNEIFI